MKWLFKNSLNIQRTKLQSFENVFFVCVFEKFGCCFSMSLWKLCENHDCVFYCLCSMKWDEDDTHLTSFFLKKLSHNNFFITTACQIQILTTNPLSKNLVWKLNTARIPWIYHFPLVAPVRSRRYSHHFGNSEVDNKTQRK